MRVPFAVLTMTACAHRSLQPEERAAIHQVLLAVEQQARNAPESQIIEDDGGEPEPLVAKAVLHARSAEWSWSVVPTMIVSEPRDWMDPSFQRRLCELATDRGADHFLLLTWWGLVQTTGSDPVDEYHFADEVSVEAAGYLVDCVTDRVLWRDVATGGTRGKQHALEAADNAIAKRLDSLLRS